MRWGEFSWSISHKKRLQNEAGKSLKFPQEERPLQKELQGLGQITGGSEPKNHHDEEWTSQRKVRR